MGVSSPVLHPDRLLPPDPAARRLYEATRDLPVISPHGHVDPRLLLDDEPLPDPATLFVTPDHHVTRLLHADGVGLDELGVGRRPVSEEASRAVWPRLCERWHLYRSTPVRLWLESELADILGVAERPSADSADRIYDQLAERLAEDAYRPRALYERFRIEVLATTDDPCSDLGAHAALRADPAWSGRVIPTLRPDAYLEPAAPGRPDAVARLGEAAGVETGDHARYVRAVEARRRHFVAHGATSTDHSHADVVREPLDRHDAERIHRLALRTRRSGRASSRRSPAPTRPSTSACRGGSSTRPTRCGRFREAVTETARFSRTSGFVDDTRAFCSIPARHDVSRRVDAGVLARLVAEHRLDEEEALETAVELVAAQPRTVF